MVEATKRIMEDIRDTELFCDWLNLMGEMVTLFEYRNWAFHAGRVAVSNRSLRRRSRGTLRTRVGYFSCGDSNEQSVSSLVSTTLLPQSDFKVPSKHCQCRYRVHKMPIHCDASHANIILCLGPQGFTPEIEIDDEQPSYQTARSSESSRRPKEDTSMPQSDIETSYKHSESCMVL